MWKCRRKIRPGISLLVPFQSKNIIRKATWKWLRAYYRHALPGAEIVMGKDRKSKKAWYRQNPRPFSKTTAINKAFKKSTKDVIVVLDADAYIQTEVLTHCAERIRFARKAGVRLWFVPYRRLMRLTLGATVEILDSPVTRPFFLPIPPVDIESVDVDASGYGRLYGAMVQIFPREAFELVEGADERFSGWGSEDLALVQALDTLWGPHKNTANDVLHLWHPRIPGDRRDGKGKTYKVRYWEGQESFKTNEELAAKYNEANGDPGKMWGLISER